MAFTRIKEGGRYVADQKEYVCDEVADLDTILDDFAGELPVGTIADIVGTGERYMLDSTGEWVLQPGGTGGGGSSGYSFATDGEVAAMLTRVFG